MPVVTVQVRLILGAFFTERERPTETVMHKRCIVFSMV